MTDMYGEFVLTEEEYNHWEGLLAIQQESEDLLFELKDVLVKQELDDYMYEETKYMTTTIETIHMENICIKELKEALEKGDKKWLTENHFVKTLKNVTK